MRQRPTVLIGLALFSISLLLTLIGIETLLRLGVLNTSPAVPTIVVDRPSSRMDQPDFREPGFEIRHKRDAFRILVVGDSFAWGNGVHFEDAFPRRMETRLNAAADMRQYEVINWSRPGWNTVRQVWSLAPELGELDPDLLVLAFVLNDPEPVDRGMKEWLLSKARERQPSPGLSTWLFANSRLYSMVWGRLENSRTRLELGRFYHVLFAGEHWEACHQALKRLGRLTRHKNIATILVIFPVFDSPMDDSYPYSDLHTRIGLEAQQIGFPVLDLFDVYRGMDTRRLAVVPFTNAHPSEIAHRVAADGIIDFLVRRDYISGVKKASQSGHQQPGG